MSGPDGFGVLSIRVCAVNPGVGSIVSMTCSDAISMDGRGSAFDNAFLERLWWTVKYENIYPRAYENGHELHRGLTVYFEYYNNERTHSALDKLTPAEVFKEGGTKN